MATRPWGSWFGTDRRFTVDTGAAWGATTGRIVATAIFYDAPIYGQVVVNLDAATVRATTTVAGAEKRIATLSVLLDAATLHAHAELQLPNVHVTQLIAEVISNADPRAHATQFAVELVSSTLTAPAFVYGAVTLNGATLHAQAQAAVRAAVAVALDDARLSAALGAGNAARAAIVLDDVVLVANIATPLSATVTAALDSAQLRARAVGAVVPADLSATVRVTLDDATLSARAGIGQPVVVVPPVHGNTGGGLPRSRRMPPPTWVMPYQVEPRSLLRLPRRAKVAAQLDDAQLSSGATVVTPVAIRVTLDGARVRSRACVRAAGRVVIYLDDARAAAAARVDWRDVIAEDDELLAMLDNAAA